MTIARTTAGINKRRTPEKWMPVQYHALVLKRFLDADQLRRIAASYY